MSISDAGGVRSADSVGQSEGNEEHDSVRPGEQAMRGTRPPRRRSCSLAGGHRRTSRTSGGNRSNPLNHRPRRARLPCRMCLGPLRTVGGEAEPPNEFAGNTGRPCELCGRLNPHLRRTMARSPGDAGAQRNETRGARLAAGRNILWWIQMSRLDLVAGMCTVSAGRGRIPGGAVRTVACSRRVEADRPLAGGRLLLQGGKCPVSRP